MKEEIRINYLGLETKRTNESQSDSRSRRRVQSERESESFGPLPTIESTTIKTSHKDKFWHDLQCLISSNDVPSEAKSSRVIDFLEDLLGTVVLRCKHLANIIENFQFGIIEKCLGFGSYRTELVVTLFPRILDLANFKLILAVLTPQEIACLYCRIGW